MITDILWRRYTTIKHFKSNNNEKDYLFPLIGIGETESCSLRLRIFHN